MPSWSHRIILNSVDITSSCLLNTQIEEGETESHLCDVIYYPPTGAQDSDALLWQTLEVDVDVGSGWQRLFDGKIIEAVWRAKDRSYLIRGSNRLQEYFRSLGSRAAILSALTGSVYSDALFGEPPEDLWEYAERCISTLEKDVHLDRTGSLVQIDWAAKGTADHVLTSADVHKGAYELERPDSDELINQASMTYQYRVRRLKVRKHTISWSAWRNNTGIQSWCEWAVGPETEYTFYLPMLPMVQSVLQGGSWNVPGGVSWSTHPKSATDLCGVLGWVWINNEPEEGEIAITTASADGYVAFSQPIRETYQLTIKGTASQTFYGTTLEEEKTGSLDVPQDPSWPPSNATPKALWLTDTIGDSYEDQDDETARANDLQCMYQWGASRVRSAHRATGVRVRIDLDPDVSLADTMQITCFGMQCKGKIRRLVHRLTSRPSTEVTVAISRGNGGSTDAWSVPIRPDTRDPGYAAPASSQAINTYVGGWPGAAAAPSPDQRLGWVTNVIGSEGLGGVEVYDRAFRVQWPEIEDAAAQERLVSVPSTWEIAIPHDLLTIT